MNYMDSNRQKDALCKKMGPPLGTNRTPSFQKGKPALIPPFSDAVIFGAGGAICCAPEYSPHHPKETDGAQK